MHQGEQVALFYLDLFVEGQVVVEVKALSHLLTNDERAQVINYLKATSAPVGLLLNFSRRQLETGSASTLIPILIQEYGELGYGYLMFINKELT